MMGSPALSSRTRRGNNTLWLTWETTNRVEAAVTDEDELRRRISGTAKPAGVQTSRVGRYTNDGRNVKG